MSVCYANSTCGIRETFTYYLMSVLLPAPLAAPAAGLGMLAVQKGTISHPSEIATHVGPRALIALLGAVVAHLLGPGD